MADKNVRAFVDRIENGYAVLLIEEDGRQIDWPADQLPAEATEGTVLLITIRVER
ncbi:MAG: DUF3006 domain-containing protein [Armatimonadota bacterium]